MKKLTLLLLLLAVGLLGCSTNNEDDIVIIDGDFAEMNIFAHMAKMLIEEHTEYTVRIQPYMAYTLAFNEISAGNMDILPSYDGTLLATYLQTDPSEVPEGQTLYDYANEKAISEANVKLLGKFGHQNTYVVATSQELAQEYGLETISDLIPIADELVFAAEHSFFDEEGTIRYFPFINYYGLNFQAGNNIDIGLKYAGMDSGNMDVTLVFGSDGLNKRYNLALLEDDLGFFPEYYMAYLVRADIEEEYPGIEEVLNKLEGTFTLDSAIELNYQVDVENKEPEDVARDYLISVGLITQ